MSLIGFTDGGGMARAGRKRSTKARFRGGRLKPKPKEVEERVRLARAMPHRRGLRSNDRTSDLAESSLGRLNLKGLVSRGERAAGETFALIVASYRTVIEGPRPVRSLMPETASERAKSAEDLASVRFDCPSQYLDPIERNVSFGGRSMTVREWPCQQSPEGCQCQHRRDRYMRAYEAIAGAGRAALLAVIRVAVRGEEPNAEELVYLRRGLSAAQTHLGLTDIDERA